MIRKTIAAGGLAVLLAAAAAAATAAPAAAAPAQAVAGTIRNAIWNGHLVADHGNPVFTEEQATWMQPRLTCTYADARAGAKVGFWAGLGGVTTGLPTIFGLNTEPLFQAGTEAECDLVHGRPVRENYAVWEVIPVGFSVFFNVTFLSASAYPVRVGDTITAQIHYTGAGTGNSYTMSLSDPAQGWSWSLDCPSLTCLAGYEVPPGYPKTGETIVEDPSTTSPLADFHTVMFTNARYNDVGDVTYPVYEMLAPQTGKPETDVQTVLLNWSVTWEHPY